MINCANCKSCPTDAAIGATEKRISEENVFIMTSFLREPFDSHHNNNDILEKNIETKLHYNRLVLEKQHPEKVCSNITDFGKNTIIVTWVLLIN